MGGGLMQLVAYGAQDVYLTGNPQITFFKVVYRRHTNFSMECIRQTVSGNLSYGKNASATISRNGDLIGQIYITYKIDQSAKFKEGIKEGSDILLSDITLCCSNFGNALIRTADIEIGGQLIDRQDGRFMQIHSDITEYNPTLNPSGSTKYQKLTGTGANLTELKIDFETHPTDGNMRYNVKNKDLMPSQSTKSDTTYWVPLKFWFCRNPGLALPLIALQYHEVKVSIELQEKHKLFNYWVKDPTSGLKVIQGCLTPDMYKLVDTELWVDYYYLDTDERRRFAQVSHEYLIEQVQIKKNNFSNASGDSQINLNFNHPVKELLWVFTGDTEVNLNSGFFPGVAVRDLTDQFQPYNEFPSLSIEGVKGDMIRDLNQMSDRRPTTKKFTANLKKPSINKGAKFKLTLNGQDRFDERDSFYFSNTQLWKHHSGSGSAFPIGSIHVYSFALKPEEHQPSGTCNFSRIDSSQLHISNADFKMVHEIIIYAINYNVLRIMSGMGGLAYSN